MTKPLGGASLENSEIEIVRQADKKLGGGLSWLLKCASFFCENNLLMQKSTCLGCPIAIHAQWRLEGLPLVATGADEQGKSVSRRIEPGLS